jgi:hypothetical protein
MDAMPALEVKRSGSEAFRQGWANYTSTPRFGAFINHVLGCGNEDEVTAFVMKRSPPFVTRLRRALAI